MKQLENFHRNNTDVNVTKLFVSVGTNDIRNVQKVHHLRPQYVALLKTTKSLFPKATIYCQSLLPLPIVTAAVKNNVQAMNYMIYSCCCQERTFYLDVFRIFLGENLHRNNRLFPSSVNDIHPNTIGLSILARRYIYLIHSRRFNPLGYWIFGCLNISGAETADSKVQSVAFPVLTWENVHLEKLKVP